MSWSKLTSTRRSTVLRLPLSKTSLVSNSLNENLAYIFQSARECRARKKLRYQYLDDLILEREKANILLREEILKYQAW